MAFTNLQLAAYATKAYEEGWRYWYGTVGYPCTQSLLDQKSKQYPGHYTASRMPTYRKHIAQGLMCADCVG